MSATAALIASPAPPETKTRAEYRPDIDGIRGAAAIMVMGFHAKVPGFEGAYIGLDLFFVVSGYVITGLLMSEYQKTGKIKWGAFYARRARRLIPAKATMLIGVLILNYFLLDPTGSQQETAESAAAAAGFVSNFFFLAHSDHIHYFAHQPGSGVLLHTWSLAVEEQFYIAVPLALLVCWLLAKALRVPAVRMLLPTTIALGAASAWLAIAWSHSHPDAAYYLPITRAFEFLIGVALALVVKHVKVAYDVREVMGIVGALMIAYCLYQPMPVEGYPSYWALLPCGATALIVWSGVGGPTAVTRFLSVRFLVGLGLVSYGWYLWHWPLLVIGEGVNAAEPPLWARVGLVLLALGIAYLSYRYIEGLFYKRSGSIRKGRSWGPRPVVISGVIAMSLVAALSWGGYALAVDQSRTPHWEGVQQQLTDVPQMPTSCLQVGQYIPTQAGKCELNTFDPTRPTVVLWGDSHAWMYIPAVLAAAEKRDVNLVSFVMGACPPFEAPDSLKTECAQSNRLALDYVTKLADRKHAPPYRVILSASWETYLDSDSTQLPAGMSVDYLRKTSSLFYTGAPQLFSALSDLGADVDVVGPTAIIPRSAPYCLSRDRPFVSCDPPRTLAIAHEAETDTWLQTQMTALPDSSRLIDVTQALCNETTCFAAANGIVNYFDDNHLSATLSLKLKRYFMPSFRAVTRDRA